SSFAKMSSGREQQRDGIGRTVGAARSSPARTRPSRLPKRSLVARGEQIRFLLLLECNRMPRAACAPKATPASECAGKRLAINAMATPRPAIRLVVFVLG